MKERGREQKWGRNGRKVSHYAKNFASADLTRTRGEEGRERQGKRRNGKEQDGQ